MMRITKWMLLLLGSTLIVAAIAGSIVFAWSSGANAQTGDVPLVNPVFPGQEPGGDMLIGPGDPQRPGGRLKAGTFLAEALGITVEELQAAFQSARQTLLGQAVELGLITQDQAEAIQEGYLAPGRKLMTELKDQVDFEAALANELGITTEELDSAKEEAHDAARGKALEEGLITPEQADLREAMRALKGYIDREALIAGALGITVEQLQEYRDNGTRLPEIMDELGLTREEFQISMQSAFEAALQKAVDDGVITAEQMQLILENKPAGGFGGRRFQRPGRPGFSGSGGAGGSGFPPGNPSDNTGTGA